MSCRRCAFPLARRMFSICHGHRAMTVTTVQSSSDVPVVYVSRMKSVLEANQVGVKDGPTCLQVASCPVGCSEQPKGKFFVNKFTGLYVCHACGKTGPWQWLEKRLLDKKKKETEPVFPEQTTSEKEDPVPDDVLARCKPASVVSDEVLLKCLNYLNLKCLKKDIFAQLGALVGPTEILLPLRGPNQDIGGWKCISAPEEGNERPQEKIYGTKSMTQLLLANDQAWSSSKVVLVPSAADLLALTAVNVPCICVEPQILPQEVLPRFEDFKEVSIWFGQYLPQGKRMARKIGIQRCKIVRSMESMEGPHEEVLSKGFNAQLAQKVERAEKMSHPAIVSFASLRAEVFDAVTRTDKSRGVPWQRFPVLTSILGGFRDGELTVLTGPTGSGKTTFLSEYSLDLCQQGVSTLWGSFEIRNTRLAKTMMTQLAGVNLEANISRFDEFADKMEQLPLHFLDFHGQQPLKTVMSAVNHAQYIYDVSHVIIDNVQFMLGLGDSESKFIDRFYRQDQVIQSFRSFATSTNCHVTLVIHPRKESDAIDLTANSIFGSAKASQEADNVIILQSGMSSAVDLKQRKYLQVAKNRYSGDLGLMQLDFNKDNLSFVKKKKPPVVKLLGPEPLRTPQQESAPLKVTNVKADNFEHFLQNHQRVIK